MAILATVNGQALELADALRRSILHEEDFLVNSVVAAVIQQHAAAKGISNTDEELQLAADELRYQRGLESVEKLTQWMKSAHQTVAGLESSIDGMLLRNKIRSGIADAETEAYFAEHRLDFDRVDLYSCRLESEEKAKELLAQINDEGANFHVLTMEHSTDEDTKLKGGYVGRLTRGDLSGDLEAVIFSATPGAVIGPVKTEKGWNLFKVAAIHKASLENEREAIRLKLFNELVAKLLTEAQVLYPVLEA